jgi:hypothetical protein
VDRRSNSTSGIVNQAKWLEFNKCGHLTTLTGKPLTEPASGLTAVNPFRGPPGGHPRVSWQGDRGLGSVIHRGHSPNAEVLRDKRFNSWYSMFSSAAHKANAMKTKAAKKAPKRAVAKAIPSEPAAAQDKDMFSEGDQVSHQSFGKGKVVSIRDDKITVQFGKGVTKEILASFLQRKR